MLLSFPKALFQLLPSLLMLHCESLDQKQLTHPRESSERCNGWIRTLEFEIRLAGFEVTNHRCDPQLNRDVAFLEQAPLPLEGGRVSVEEQIREISLIR